MLTNKDIDRMVKVFATKEDIRGVVERLDGLESLMRGLIAGVDKLATSVDKLLLEYAAISEQLTRHERWIKQIAKKAGVALTE